MNKAFLISGIISMLFFSGCNNQKMPAAPPEIMGKINVQESIPAAPEQKSDFETSIDLIEQNQFSESKALLNTLIEKEPAAKTLLQAFAEFEKSEGSSPGYLKTLIARGLMRHEKFSLAVSLLHSVLAEQKSYRDAWILLGYAHLAMQNIDQAINSLEIAKKLDPSKPETLYLLAHAYFSLGRYDAARTYAETAQQLDYQPSAHIEELLHEIEIASARREREASGSAGAELYDESHLKKNEEQRTLTPR